MAQPDLLTNQTEWRTRFDEIWNKFGGTEEGERKLAKKLLKKYGTVVQFETAQLANVKKSLKAEVSSDIRHENQFTEEWYLLTEKEAGSGCVNFQSDRFDPLAALSPDNERAVVAENTFLLSASLLDRVDLFRSFLPRCDPMFRQSSARNATIRTDQLRMDSTVTKKIKPPSCFANIAAMHQEGPMSVLDKAFTGRYRIRVVTRYVNSIRGTLTGHLIAFDKHMNLILKDVDEHYSPRRGSLFGDNTDDRSCEEFELQRRIESCRRSQNNTSIPWTIRQRHMKQIMVRGDIVVAVYKATDERSTWTTTNQSPS